jgi:hypothetical protein
MQSTQERGTNDIHFFQAWFPILELRDNIYLSKPLRKAALNYYHNMHRVHESIISTACFVGTTARMAWAEANADRDVENEFGKSVEQSTDDAVKAFWEDRWQRNLIAQIQLDEQYEGGPAQRFYGQSQNLMLKAMDRYPAFPLKGGLEATLSSALIHASAAMEVCLGEIWHAANALAAVKNRHIETERLRIYHLAQVMRGVSQENPKGGGLFKNFSSLAGSRGQYSVAFCRDSSDIDAAMSSYDLDALTLVRNLLVHKNGVPDEMFRGQAKGIPILDPLVALPPHRKISIEGQFVSSLLTSSLRAVKSVVLSVDQWLQRNK